MKKLLLAALLSWLSIAPALAANFDIPGLPAAASVAGTDLFECSQTGTSRKCTSAQINTYVQSLWGAGCATFLTTPSSANLRACLTDEVGTGSAYFVGGALGTPASVTLTNGTGLPVSTGVSGLGTGVATALGVNTGTAGAFVVLNGALGTPSSGTLTNATGLPIATGISGLGTGVAGAAAAALNASTGLVGALTATNGNCVVGNGTAWTSTTCPGGTAANPTGTAGPTAVNGVASTYMRSDGAPAVQQGSSSQKGIVQVDGTTITAASGVISAAPISAVPSVQSGTNYPIVDGDRAKVIYLSNAAAQTPTLPSAATLTSSNGWFVTVCNIAAGIQTLTPTTSTIGGAASLAIPGGSAARPVCWNAVSDGTNYSLVPAGNNNTIFSGTAAMGTSAITAGTCATVVTVSAPGVATGDIASAGFNGDPTATTGYLPTAMLTLVPFPTANNVNVKACNLTSSSITPSALTLNIRVNR